MSERKHEEEHHHIDEYVEWTEEQLFWRYFISRTLRTSLVLLRAAIPDRNIGLVLPLQGKNISITHPKDLPELGKCLIAWLGKDGFSVTFPVSFSSFTEPNDFRIFPLKTEIEAVPQDRTLVFVERKAPHLTYPFTLVETIRRLLAPIYESIEDWQPCFGSKIHGVLDPTTDFYSGGASSDVILNGLANMVVRLGGQLDDGRPRWRFCCILLPSVLSKGPVLPLQKHNLVVRAQSKDGPYMVGEKTFFADVPVISLALRAFQSGRISYRPIIVIEDATIPQDEVRNSLGSLIAVPIGGKDGLTLGVIYVGSSQPDAFTKEDQRILGMMGKIMEELLVVYRIRPRLMENLMDVIDNPHIVDPYFKDFPSENDFMKDVAKLVMEVKTRTPTTGSSSAPLVQSKAGQFPEQVVSFIAIDMDNQSILASKYSDQMARNLSRDLGIRIQGQLRLLFAGYDDCRLYHVHSDRFYMLLKGFPLGEARERAERLRGVLGEPYRIDAQRTSIEQPRIPAMELKLQDLTVRVAVTSYSYSYLNEVLQRYSDIHMAAEVSAMIIHFLDRGLNWAYEQGGDVVVFWDHERKDFVSWSSQKLNSEDT